ncbi:hypothetical protein EJ05DRAFT_498557 [Pseudovirgaria hyperparasitica]|uniref:DNA repair protein Rad26 n=1 Tax=Pseudovirgaria hyperparasitica TaxID=470096 RepID=A0A6A6WEL7_9PEZI|nr:uncharacterized protein EJ05DRAFT_498557 [Pseudovirgaria hyperparasitica]KAF2760599.1 hypothetical protein EJ05DRAFT_498557 [Pseudovirgaria hyperparasitica]
MAVQDAEEYDFDDDDLDALPENDLVELENTAIRSTQRPTGTFATLGTTAPRATRPTIDDYGFEEENVIDLDQQGLAFHRPYNPPYASPIDRRIHNGLSVRSSRATSARGGLTVQPATSRALDENPQSSAMGDMSELQIRIAELERERDHLRSTIQSHKGEIAIVRSKHEQSAKEFERKLSVMQKVHSETFTKQNIELEKARKDRETVETNNRFLEHDLAQEIGRTKSTRTTLKDVTNNKARTSNGSPAGTPKKNMNRSFGDGFDDEDIVMTSPSKLQARSKPSTPKVGAKRKRSALEVQSPGLPLILSESHRTLKAQESVDSNNGSGVEATGVLNLRKEDHRFEFLQRIMSYRTNEGGDLFFEALSKLSLPTAPEQSLTSLVCDKMALLPSDGDPKSFPGSFFKILLGLWDACLGERYVAPINILIHAMQFMLAFEPRETLAGLVKDLVPIALATIDIVAIPLGRSAALEEYPAERDKVSANTTPSPDLDVWTCLSLLQQMAISCILTSTETIRVFWQLVPHDFVLLMLMKAQPISHINLALQLVSTSALDASFGASSPSDTSEQTMRRETLLLDRLTYLLFETPDLEGQVGPVAVLELANLRIEVLSTLSAIAVTAHGGESLARHRQAIGRMVRYLSDAIDSLYDFNQSSHLETIQAVNLCVRLLHHIIKGYPQIVDMKSKLDAVQGGTHKHLVALTRLAFSDTLVLEAGIEEEVTDMAHQLLDEFLSPEEGEALCQVFSSGKSVT